MSKVHATLAQGDLTLTTNHISCRSQNHQPPTTRECCEALQGQSLAAGQLNEAALAQSSTSESAPGWFPEEDSADKTTATWLRS